MDDLFHPIDEPKEEPSEGLFEASPDLLYPIEESQVLRWQAQKLRERFREECRARMMLRAENGLGGDNVEQSPNSPDITSPNDTNRSNTERLGESQ